MYPKTISPQPKISPDQPFFNLDSCIDKAEYGNNHNSLLILTQRLRNPLTCIYLAVELLESSTELDDQEIYLDIIKRGSLGINILTNELIKYQIAEELQEAIMI